MTLSEKVSENVSEKVPDHRSAAPASATGWTPPALRSAVQVVPEEPVETVDIQQEAEQARQRGYEAGFAEGLARARAQGEEATAQMNALLFALASSFADTDSSLVRDLLDLNKRVCEAVLRRELSTDGGTLARVLSEALAVLTDSPTEVELTLNPADAKLARELGLVDSNQVVIRESQHMQRGGLELRSGSTRVDASVEARLQAVLDSLYVDAGLPTPADATPGPAVVAAVAIDAAPDDEAGTPDAGQ